MKAKGAKILIDCLINEGVDTVFGYPGGCVLDIFDELYKASASIRQILTCHEQGASHAADGYARVTGRVGVVIATSGPGATNLVTGIANAYMDSIPLVAITGNVAISGLGRDSFQEIDITGVTMPITKHNYIVKDISELSRTVSEAFRIARSGRPGPVLIDIPKNIQQQEAEYELFPVKPVTHKPPDGAAAAEIAELINKAERPLVYMGGGVILSGAEKEFKRFAETIGAPVASSMMGLGGFPGSHPLFIGMIGMHGEAAAAAATQECDVLIAIGARFSDRVAGDRTKFAPQAHIIHIDVDNAELNKNVKAFLTLVSDAKGALTALTERLKKTAHP
ncbi:MAG: acetolactate synthase large subunit, partial [Clostridiales bacterium]|nr:acetolactate synthase large subunit [Clostridiales bacterium]